MPEIRGITIAVGEWYARTLEVCLARNMRHLTECLVVTDAATEPMLPRVPGVRVCVTDAFTRFGARFNKGLGMEIGLDDLGRHGWCVIWDADTLFPDSLPLDQLRRDVIHGARRRILKDPGQWSPDLNWRALPRNPDASPIGFFQLFHAEAAALRGKRPWYDVSFGHAGGGDAYFLNHWPSSQRKMLPIEVLHLGPVDTHWMGTDQEGKDLMARYVHENNWRRAMANHSKEAVERAGELPGRIQVPGFDLSTFELPFERRARAKGRANQPPSTPG